MNPIETLIVSQHYFGTICGNIFKKAPKYMKITSSHNFQKNMQLGHIDFQET